MPKLHEALAQFVNVARGMIGERSPIDALTCVQADAFVGVIRAIGDNDLADSLEAIHLSGDTDRGVAHCTDHELPVAPPLPLLIDERVRTIRPAVLSTGGTLGTIRLVESTTGTLHKQTLNVLGEWETIDTPA